MIRGIRAWSAALLIAVLAIFPATAAWPASEVNLYSARQEALIKPLLDEFTEQTGIKVNLVTGKADALLQRLEAEGRNSPADVLLTVDAGRLHRAKALGVVQPIESAVLNAAIPAAYRDPEGYWWGLSLRARPIMYVKGKVEPGGGAGGPSQAARTRGHVGEQRGGEITPDGVEARDGSTPGWPLPAGPTSRESAAGPCSRAGDRAAGRRACAVDRRRCWPRRRPR